MTTNISGNSDSLLWAVIIEHPGGRDAQEYAHMMLIETALYHAPRPLSFGQIELTVKNHTVNSIAIETTDLRRALDRLVKEKRVNNTNLQHSLNSRVESRYRNHFQQVTATQNEWRLVLRKAIESQSNTSITDEEFHCVHRTVIVLFYDIIHRFSLKMLHVSNIADIILEEAEFDSIMSGLRSCFVSYGNSERVDNLCAAVVQALHQNLVNERKSLQDLLEDVHAKAIMAITLGQEPGTIAERQRIAGAHKIYLDSSVLFELFWGEKRARQRAKELVDAIIAVGAEPRISPRTYARMQAIATNARQFKGNKLSEELQSALSPLPSVTIKANWESEAADSGNPREWQNWKVLGLNLDGQINRYGIVAGAEASPETAYLNDPNIHRIKEALNIAANKDESTVETDAANILLVLHERQKFPKNELGEVVWMVTFDEKLTAAEELLKNIAPEFHLLFDNYLSYIHPIAKSKGQKFGYYPMELLQSVMYARPRQDPDLIDRALVLDELMSSGFPLSSFDGVSYRDVRDGLIQMGHEGEGILSAIKQYRAAPVSKRIGVHRKHLVDNAGRYRYARRGDSENMATEIAKRAVRQAELERELAEKETDLIASTDRIEQLEKESQRKTNHINNQAEKLRNVIRETNDSPTRIERINESRLIVAIKRLMKVIR